MGESLAFLSSNLSHCMYFPFMEDSTILDPRFLASRWKMNELTQFVRCDDLNYGYMPNRAISRRSVVATYLFYRSPNLFHFLSVRERWRFESKMGSPVSLPRCTRLSETKKIWIIFKRKDWFQGSCPRQHFARTVGKKIVGGTTFGPPSVVIVYCNKKIASINLYNAVRRFYVVSELL